MSKKKVNNRVKLLESGKELVDQVKSQLRLPRYHRIVKLMT